MQLYHFYPNGYGSEYYVMALHRAAALKYLLTSFELKKEAAPNKYCIEEVQEDIDRWSNVAADKPSTFPSEYTLNEYSLGQVIRSEIA